MQHDPVNSESAGGSARLIYILNHYSPADTTHFPHILHLLEVIATQGVEVALLIEKAGELPEFATPGISATRLKTKLPLIRHLELFIRIVAMIRQGFTVTFVRIAAPPAIVASIAHRIFGGKSFLWQSGTTQRVDLKQPWSLRKARWYVTSHWPSKLARRAVHYFVTGPDAMVDYYAEEVGVPREKIRLLYNDVEVGRFSQRLAPEERDQMLEELALPRTATVLLIVHRLSPVRRTLMYLEPALCALKESGKDWALIVAGEGSELPEARRLVDRLGLADRVRFLGGVPNRKIHLLYAAADLFLQPTFTEGFPRVLIEAMAAGLPVVSTDAGGSSQLLGEMQAEYLVSRDDPALFARSAVSLLQSPDKWPQLAAENFAQVQRFSTPAVAAMYKRVLFS